MIVSLVFSCFNIVVLIRIGSAHIHLVSECAGLLLSGCTGAFSAVELSRCFRRLPPTLPHAMSVVVILVGLVASLFWSVGGLPMARRSVDTTSSPNLLYPWAIRIARLHTRSSINSFDGADWKGS